jgi:hypothetical protein
MANVRFEFNGKLSDGRFFDDDSKKKIIVELEDSDLTVNEMLEEFMNFMKAIGYNFEIGERFEVTNEFKSFEGRLNLNSQDHGKSEPGYGAVPPQGQPIVDEGGAVIGIAAPATDPY